jgi:hypothetical protein
MRDLTQYAFASWAVVRRVRGCQVQADLFRYDKTCTCDFSVSKRPKRCGFRIRRGLSYQWLTPSSWLMPGQYIYRARNVSFKSSSFNTSSWETESSRSCALGVGTVLLPCGHGTSTHLKPAAENVLVFKHCVRTCVIACYTRYKSLFRLQPGRFVTISFERVSFVRTHEEAGYDSHSRQARGWREEDNERGKSSGRGEREVSPAPVVKRLS